MQAINYVLIVVGFLGLMIIFRMIKGPTVWDRLLMFNMLGSKIVMGIVLFALITQQNYMLDVALVYVLFSFISTVLLARFVKERGALS